MADEPRYLVRPIGWVESPLADPDVAPKQGDEGAPDAWLVLDQTMRPGIRDLEVGAEVIVLTWLDRAQRDALLVHPRGDQDRRELGVFSTRSPDRPNPIALHHVRILAIGRRDARRGHQAAARTSGRAMTERTRPPISGTGERGRPRVS